MYIPELQIKKKKFLVEIQDLYKDLYNIYWRASECTRAVFWLARVLVSACEKLSPGRPQNLIYFLLIFVRLIQCNSWKIARLYLI